MSASVEAQPVYRVGDAIPEQVLKDWQARRDAYKSVHWKVGMRELIPAGFLNGIPPDDGKSGLIPKTDIWRTRIMETWIGFTPLRYRNDASGDEIVIANDLTTKPQPFHSAYLFDGADLQTVQFAVRGGRALSNARTSVLTLDGSQAGGAVELWLQPAFWGVGRVFDPGTNARVDQLVDVTAPPRLRIHAVSTEGGVTVLTLKDAAPRRRQGASQELDVDLSRGSCVTRCVLYHDEQPRAEFRAAWKRDGDHWIPERWTVQTGSGTAERAQIDAECTVQNWDVNPPLDDVAFQHQIPSGERFWDERTDSVLVKGDDGQPDIPLKLYEIQQSASERRRFWIYAALGMVVLGIVIWRLRRA